MLRSSLNSHSHRRPTAETEAENAALATYLYTSEPTSDHTRLSHQPPFGFPLCLPKDHRGGKYTRSKSLYSFSFRLGADLS